MLPAGDHVGLVKTLMPHMDHFDEAEAGRISKRFVRHDAIDYYARLTIGKWTWLDPRCLPSFVVHFAPHSTGVLTSNPGDLYWTVAMVRLRAASSWENGPKLTISLEHCMPWFDRYEARVDGGPWQAQEETFDWPMREGENVLEVRGVNVCGRAGIPARLEVAYSPPKW